MVVRDVRNNSFTIVYSRVGHDVYSDRIKCRLSLLIMPFVRGLSAWVSTLKDALLI